MFSHPQIIVSTHFDDAALSLAHVLQAAGPRATVVTVCGGAPAEGLPVSAWDAACGFASGPEAARSRAAEDRRACAATGARSHPLDHPDSPYGPLPEPAILRSEVGPLLQPDGILWLPAGIRNDDHAHVHHALRPLAGRVQIYADLPYAGRDELPGAEEVRLTDEAFERKLVAVRCHASQIPSLERIWPDMLERGGPLACERFGPATPGGSATWHSRSS